jgi:hypothetical protein
MEPSSVTDIMVSVPDFERGLRDWEATCGLLLRGAAAVVVAAAPIRNVFVDDTRVSGAQPMRNGGGGPRRKRSTSSAAPSAGS